MQTGEYRGFVGQFSRCLRDLVVTWRAPLLLSLALHALLFWPRPLQENDFGVTLGAAAGAMQARLKPGPPALPEASAKLPAPVRHAPVTQSSSQGADRRTVTPHVAPLPVEPPGLVLQPTAELDAGAVRAYRLAWARVLANSGLREKLGADMRGAMEVGVAVSAAGQVRDIVVLRSSGDAALDVAVIAVMRNAVPAVGLPAVMPGREFVLTIPVEVGAAPIISAAGR